MPNALDLNTTFQRANAKWNLSCLWISVPPSSLEATCTKKILDLLAVAYLYTGAIEENEKL